MTDPVIVVVSIEHDAMEREVSIPRDEWNKMSPAQRRHRLGREANSLLNDTVSVGWHIENEDDDASTFDNVLMDAKARCTCEKLDWSGIDILDHDPVDHHPQCPLPTYRPPTRSTSFVVRPNPADVRPHGPLGDYNDYP